MAEKLFEYQGCTGWFHGVRDNIRERYLQWKERNPKGFASCVKSYFVSDPCNETNISNAICEEYSHIYRQKTRKELVRVSAAVMGIEFSYAAETAFVSPTLLKIGVEHKHMTLVWALSPLIGFFVTPILGSLSDRCHLRFGRRRPFIFIMSLGVLFGLILVPNGENLGYAMGDIKPPGPINSTILGHRITNAKSENNFSLPETWREVRYNNSHPWGVLFTVLGTVLLDFDADACQSPCRAYLLDVTVPDDHARGLSTFTVMAGLGGFFGYALGGINWDATAIGAMLGGHVKAVFTLITFIFVFCVMHTITSFKEIPLGLLELKGDNINHKYDKFEEERIVETQELSSGHGQTYGAVMEKEKEAIPLQPSQYASIEEKRPENFAEEGDLYRKASIAPPPNASLMLYLKSIVFMPNSIRLLCLTNLFCWMAHVCYSLYFTDFVGEAVFEGNPIAPEGNTARDLYEAGVRFGCWGMSMYSLSCSCYSIIIEKLIKMLGAKKVYVGGLLVYSSGMLLMAIVKNKVGVILFSWTAGVMYSTLFTMPYLLIAHYHAIGTFELISDGATKADFQIRGLGTDIALVSSMVFLAQFILSICMGTIVSVSGTTTAVVVVASILAFCGSISATQVLYLDL